MKNKLFAVATGMAVMTSAIVVPVQTEASTKTFTDVPMNSPYYKEINEMVKLGIISGYPDGEFKPNENITRKQALTMISRIPGIDLKQREKALRFNDIKSNHPEYKFYHDMQKAGLIKPDSKGNLNPNKPVTRGEMANMIFNSYDLKTGIADSFDDVDKSTEYVSAIVNLHSAGITTGDNGKFYPDKVLTREHFATFIYRAINRDENYVAKPIDKQRKLLTSGNKYLDTGTYIDFYTDPWRIPLPEGETYPSLKEKQTKEFNRLRVKNKTNGVGSRLIVHDAKYDIGTEESLELTGQRFKLSHGTWLNLLNQLIETGEVYDGEFFAVYYDFKEGRLHSAENNMYDHGG